MPPRPIALLKRFGPAVLVLIAIAAAFASGLAHHLSIHELRDRREAITGYEHIHPVLSVLAYVALYTLAIALSLPAALPLTVAGGLFFGPWVGGLAAAIGVTAGGTIVYLVCRTAAGDVLRRIAGPRVVEIEDGVRRDAFFYIMMLRLLPIMPYGLTTLALGFLEIPLLTFTAATFIGIVPLSFVYARLGWGLNRAFASHQPLNLHSLLQPPILIAFGVLALLSLSPIVIRGLRRRRAA
ncbi:MAG TPA: TVP38/TMEM64 family protein [Caulobacteraceae bacterium]|jgi:uncharacterized membrane protein YdjX (TVP38/TMEM64 family)|nr:TVP38/TMEM64 family protein [Caulobacteraceae bacterium]